MRRPKIMEISWDWMGKAGSLEQKNQLNKSSKIAQTRKQRQWIYGFSAMDKYKNAANLGWQSNQGDAEIERAGTRNLAPT